MGGGGQRQQETQTQQTQTAAATPEEQELQRLQLERRKALQPFLLETDISGFETFGIPLSRGEAAGGIFGTLGQGISPEAQERITEQALRKADFALAGQGAFDTGARAQIRADVTRDIGVSSELQRQNELFNLLNLAIGAPAQIQQPGLQETGQLSNRLQGLRPVTQFGSQFTTAGGGGGGGGFGQFLFGGGGR